MTNKTPIQELIFLIEERMVANNVPSHTITYVTMMAFKDILSDYLQKEKAFAFDCWQSGYDTAVREEHGSVSTTFYQFYEKYAAKHTE